MKTSQLRSSSLINTVDSARYQSQGMFEIETHTHSSLAFGPARDIQEPELCLLKVLGTLQDTSHKLALFQASTSISLVKQKH